jgi:hypothetical protein
MLAIMMPSDKKQVVIVQPHLSEITYKNIWSSAGGQGSGRTQEAFRLSTLETLLHTTRAAAIAVGTDLEVIASRD